MSSERIFPLDTKDKGSRFADNKTLDVETYFKPTETFQYTHICYIFLLPFGKG